MDCKITPKHSAPTPKIVDTTTIHDEGNSTLLMDAAINLSLKLQEHDYIINGIEITSVHLCDNNRLTLLINDKIADKEFLDEVDTRFEGAGIRTCLEDFGIVDNGEGLHFTYYVDIE